MDLDRIDRRGEKEASVPLPFDFSMARSLKQDVTYVRVMSARCALSGEKARQTTDDEEKRSATARAVADDDDGSGSR